MPLFPQEEGAQVLEGAPGRMAWTREQGTRKLVIGFIALIALCAGIWWVRDFFLLRTLWPELQPDADGLTVVGTLDSREAYDRNLFRVIQAEGASRAELTSWGWESTFTESNGKLCSVREGNTIQHVIGVDSLVGYAMLEPYLRAAVRKELHRPNAFAEITRETPVSIPNEAGTAKLPAKRTLGALLDYYRGEGESANAHEAAPMEGGSGSGHEVDHGLAIPGENLIHVCPVVLVGKNFSDGWVQEFPPSILGGKTYSVHLGLTSEGRSRFYQWSRFHAHENLVFVLKNQVVTAGRIAQTMDVSDWEITNVKDLEAAKALVDYVNGLNHKR